MHSNGTTSRFSNLSSAVWAAFDITIALQVMDPSLSELVHSKLVGMKRNSGNTVSLPPNTFDFAESNPVAGDLVLIKSRREQANAVIGCIRSGMPVLLEGPAAVGKTALIEFLARRLLRGKSAQTPLLQVNNSASTTVQDYLGSYLPSGNGDFRFREGALSKAMRHGYWFLAEEFNLAEPAVVSILYPILEGQATLSIPGTDQIITAHPDFRFFATQNSAKGYAGRFVDCPPHPSHPRLLLPCGTRPGCACGD